MAKYMKDHFDFFGVPAPQRRKHQRLAFASWKPTRDDIVDFVSAAWEQPEREFQYAACDVLEKNDALLGSASLEFLFGLVVTKSWWDSVDAIAPRVGSLIRRDPGLVEHLDVWVDHENLWVRRVALLHQLRYKVATDGERLFSYCERRSHETEFFIRKAIGWALREYAKTDPEAVRGFVQSHRALLSPLSQREALKNIGV